MSDQAWRSIESAPKDGTWVLLYSYALGRVPGIWWGKQTDGFGFMVGPWGDKEGPFDLRDDEQPTHWFALPEIPLVGGQK